MNVDADDRDFQRCRLVVCRLTVGIDLDRLVTWPAVCLSPASSHGNGLSCVPHAKTGVHSNMSDVSVQATVSFIITFRKKNVASLILYLVSPTNRYQPTDVGRRLGRIQNRGLRGLRTDQRRCRRYSPGVTPVARTKARVKLACDECPSPDPLPKFTEGNRTNRSSVGDNHYRCFTESGGVRLDRLPPAPDARRYCPALRASIVLRTALHSHKAGRAPATRCIRF
jgi:hypothetical protein